MNELINTITQGDCLEVMKRIPDGSIDLTVTSPPYDNLRTYKGFEWDFEGIAKELYRVTKEGVVVIWVVGDATVNGSETGTSFRHALYFKEIGFRLHDTMIYRKNSYPFPPSNRYYQQFEYMFVLSKGAPKTANLLRVETKWQKKNEELSTTRNADGSVSEMKYEKGKPTRIMDNVWDVNTGYMRTTKDKYAYGHPAIFPEELAENHVKTWSNPGDVVLDPFGGSGTTAKMSILNDRKYIYIDMAKEYCEIARRRINEAKAIKNEKESDNI